MASTTELLIKRYGNPLTHKAAFTKNWVGLYVFPAWMAAIFPPYAGQKVTRQYLNKDCVAPLEAVFKDLLATGLWKELKTFDGCWNIRPMRGSITPSVHSWALALDFNAQQNPLGVTWGSRPGMFSKAFLDIWKKHGWTCGAFFGGGRGDAMHFEYTVKARE